MRTEIWRKHGKECLTFFVSADQKFLMGFFGGNFVFTAQVGSKKSAHLIIILVNKN